MAQAYPLPALGNRLSRKLCQRLGVGKYNRWFRSARLGCGDGGLDITVPNRFIADWIDHHYHDELLAVAESELGDGAEVRLNVDPNCRGEATMTAATMMEPPAPPAGAHAVHGVNGTNGASVYGVSTEPRRSAEPGTFVTRPAALRYELDDFVPGPQNELACTAISRLADGGDDGLKMIFIHGGCGLGKTHLLQGLCRRYAQQHRDARWCYTTAEHFTTMYVDAVKRNKRAELRNKFRHLALLAIDDVHFLANKYGTQNEFAQLFDALDLCGARLVMASDAHPKQIHQLNDALTSRLMASMVVRVEMPDRPTRRRIIQSLARRRSMALMESVVESLAELNVASVRELEGILTKLAALAAMERRGRRDQLANGANRPPAEPIGHALLNQLLHGVASAPTLENRPVRFEVILQTVCDRLGVERSQVLSRSRHRRIVLARSAAIYLARRLTTLSYPELARALDRPNHSTIVTAAQRIEQQVRQQRALPMGDGLPEASMDQLIEQLRRAVLETAAG